MKLLLSIVIAAAISGLSAANANPGKARVEITVTEQGFTPSDVKVPAKKPVTIVFVRKTDKTCAKHITLAKADGSKIEKDLPLDKPVEITTTFPAAGKLTYACGMDMMHGTITVQ